jgi:hypothetical protein
MAIARILSNFFVALLMQAWQAVASQKGREAYRKFELCELT